MSLFQLHDRFIDPSSRRLSAYFSQLFILAGADFLQYCILDTDGNNFIALSDYRADLSTPMADSWPDELDRLISSDEFLHRKYPAVIFAITSPYHTLLPSSLYESGSLSAHLNLNFDLPDGLYFRADRLAEPDLWNVYGTEKAWNGLLTKHYPQAILYHSATPLLTRLSDIQKQNPGITNIFLNFSGKRFEIAIYSDINLLFFNTFKFEISEDILYFTLYALEQLKIRTNELVVCMGGDVEPESGTMNLLREYIPEVRLIDRPEGFHYSPFFDFPAHKYQSLFSLALCGS